MFGAVGRFFKSIWYLMTGKVDSASANIRKNPHVIQATFDNIVREKTQRIGQYKDAVAALIAQEEKKRSRISQLTDEVNRLEQLKAGAAANFFEMRQTPHVFGAGLIDAISEATITANADPADGDADGISGRAHGLADGRVGRFGWKADVPSVAEFVRDAMAAEIGLTLPAQPGLSFGITTDLDGVADPELPLKDVEDITFFMSTLAGPPQQTPADPALVAQGGAVFSTIGCAKCHIPSLPSSLGDVPLFSDLLLHDILPAGSPGIESGSATQTEFRTAPLWGLSRTPPYFHDGSADSVDLAIRKHDGEALTVRQTYEALSDADRTALLAFLDTL